MRKATAPCSHYTVPYRLEACNTSGKKTWAVFGNAARAPVSMLEQVEWATACGRLALPARGEMAADVIIVSQI